MSDEADETQRLREQLNEIARLADELSERTRISPEDACAEARYQLQSLIEETDIPASMIVGDILNPLFGRAIVAFNDGDESYAQFVHAVLRFTSCVVRSLAAERNLRWQRVVYILSDVMEDQDFRADVEWDIDQLPELE